MRRLLLVLALFVLAAPAVAGSSDSSPWARGGQAVAVPAPSVEGMLGAAGEAVPKSACSASSVITGGLVS